MRRAEGARERAHEARGERREGGRRIVEEEVIRRDEKGKGRQQRERGTECARCDRR